MSEITIDSSDSPDGSDGGYDRHGNYVVAEAMQELVLLRAENEWLCRKVNIILDKVHELTTLSSDFEPDEFWLKKEEVRDE